MISLDSRTPTVPTISPREAARQKGPRLNAQRLHQFQVIMPRTWIVLGTNFILTLLFWGAFAPAAHRYSAIFRLGGQPPAATFIILPLYIGPALLWIRPPVRWYVPGFIIGVLLAIPLALWTLLQNYPLSKAPIILVIGALQGLVVSWIAHQRKWS